MFGNLSANSAVTETGMNSSYVQTNNLYSPFPTYGSCPDIRTQLSIGPKLWWSSPGNWSGDHWRQFPSYMNIMHISSNIDLIQVAWQWNQPGASSNPGPGVYKGYIDMSFFQNDYSSYDILESYAAGFYPTKPGGVGRNVASTMWAIDALTTSFYWGGDGASYYYPRFVYFMMIGYRKTFNYVMGKRSFTGTVDQSTGNISVTSWDKYAGLPDGYGVQGTAMSTAWRSSDSYTYNVQHTIRYLPLNPSFSVDIDGVAGGNYRYVLCWIPTGSGFNVTFAPDRTAVNITAIPNEFAGKSPVCVYAKAEWVVADTNLSYLPKAYVNGYNSNGSVTDMWNPGGQPGGFAGNGNLQPHWFAIYRYTQPTTAYTP